MEEGEAERLDERAREWLDGLMAEVDHAIRHAPYAGEYGPDPTSVLAAADVVATALGCPSARLSGEVGELLEKHAAKQAAVLAPLARRAVQGVRRDSEFFIKEFWEDFDRSEWLAAVDDLLSRLPV